jgi:hypothetical protein
LYSIAIDEYFLLQALQHLYAIPAQRAAEILKHLQIIHPYGDVGALPTPAPFNTSSGSQGSDAASDAEIEAGKPDNFKDFN